MDAGDVEVHITGPALYTDYAGGEGGRMTPVSRAPTRGRVLVPRIPSLRQISPHLRGGLGVFELVQVRTGCISGSLVSMTTHLRVTIFGRSWSLAVLENVEHPNPTPGSLYVLGHPPLGGISGLNSIS